MIIPSISPNERNQCSLFQAVFSTYMTTILILFISLRRFVEQKKFSALRNRQEMERFYANLETLTKGVLIFKYFKLFHG